MPVQSYALRHTSSGRTTTASPETGASASGTSARPGIEGDQRRHCKPDISSRERTCQEFDGLLFPHRSFFSSPWLRDDKPLIDFDGLQSDDAAPPAENPWAHLDGEGGAGDDDDDIYG